MQLAKSVNIRKKHSLNDLIIDLKSISEMCDDKYQFVNMAINNGYTFQEIADWLCVSLYQPMGWYWAKMKKGTQ